MLEEKDDNASEGAHDSSETESEAGNDEQRVQDKDVLGKLMGRKKPTEPVGIQEVTERQVWN